MINLLHLGIISSRNASGDSPALYDIYVSLSGNDTTGNGSIGNPYRTLFKAVSVATSGQSIKLGTGTFVETNFILVPVGVSIYGDGTLNTIVTGSAALYDTYTSGGSYKLDKFLIQVVSVSLTAGNQTFKDFSVDGDSRQIRGGLYIAYRTNVIVENVDAYDCGANAFWLRDIETCEMTNVTATNSGFGSSGFCLGCVNLTHVNGLIMTDVTVDEDIGYGVKCMAFTGDNYITGLELINTTITVEPEGAWNGGASPNIAFEAWQETSTKLDIHFNGCYIDNIISLVVSFSSPTWTGTPTVIIENTFLDHLSRAGGHAYGIECGIGDIEISNVYFTGGTTGVVNWGPKEVRYWKFHHSTFYNLHSFYPTAIYNNYQGAGLGMRNALLANNTVHLTSTSTATFNSQPPTIHFIEMNNNVDITDGEISNNVVINVSGQSACKFINLTSGGSTVSGTNVRNNFGQSLNGGINQGITGITYSNNATGTAQIAGSGNRPQPYYNPTAAGNLDETGVDVGLPFTGSNPSKGAFEI
jgi:hypothetical protein